MQPTRSGPTPPKYGSGTLTPGVLVPSGPKYTPTGVATKVSPAPMSSATSLMSRSASVKVGFFTTPSIRWACS
ncbi:Uncharacterised protein [Mycobacteroides abscessus subsp. bolletii]|nr:Uncharacterised protein [Mycobacteroides abscessus subsp. bolletii]